MMPRRRLWLFAVLVLLALVGLGAVVAVQQLTPSGVGIQTTRVARGSFDLKMHTTGELRPSRSAMLVAPSVGGSLYIVRMATTGTPVKAGETVIEFDPAEQEYNLQQSRSELLQAEQEIKKLRADAAVQAAQDQVDLLTARFAVRRAELDVTGNEFVGAIDAKKNLLSLEEAKRRLAQLEEDVRSRTATNRASLALLDERRSKARLAVERAQRNIDNMIVRAPFDGLVSVKPNQDAAGGFFFSGMILPDYRAGDMVFGGRVIGEVLEVSRMEIIAKVSETDRAQLKPGATAEVRIDALPGQVFNGRVKSVSGMASRGFFFGSAAPSRQFDALFELDRPDNRLRPGVTTQILVAGERLKDTHYVPRQAVFERNGKPVVYVRQSTSFVQREVKVTHRTESHVALEGLTADIEVALVDPTARPTNEPDRPASPSTATAGVAR